MANDKLYRNLAIALGAYLLIGGIALTFLFLNTKIADRTDPNDPARVTRGEQIYQSKCAVCHGKDLKGQPNWGVKNPDGTYPAPPQDETGHTWEHSDRALFDYIRWGGQENAPRGFKSSMPAFNEQLNTEEIWSILAYIKSHWPDETRRRQALANFVGGIHAHY